MKTDAKRAYFRRRIAISAGDVLLPLLCIAVMSGLVVRAQVSTDAAPSLSVATIKPNDSGVPMMQDLRIEGRNFVTRNSSLGDLIAFAYKVQVKQIAGAPDWLNQDRYDITAVPDGDGVPSMAQAAMMVQGAAGEPVQAGVPSRDARDAGLRADRRKEWTEVAAAGVAGVASHNRVQAGAQRAYPTRPQWDTGQFCQRSADHGPGPARRGRDGNPGQVRCTGDLHA